jgi:hypothetical protein
MFYFINLVVKSMVEAKKPVDYLFEAIYSVFSLVIWLKDGV